METKTRSFLAITLLLFTGIIAACQPTPKVESEGAYTLHITQIDTTSFPLVNVYVAVQDANGEPKVVNTEKLQLLENGQPVSNQNIQGTGDVGSLTTLLLIDNSGSMNYAEKLTGAKEVAKEYINQMRAGDQAGIITFNTQVNTVQERLIPFPAEKRSSFSQMAWTIKAQRTQTKPSQLLVLEDYPSLPQVSGRSQKVKRKPMPTAV